MPHLQNELACALFLLLSHLGWNAMHGLIPQRNNYLQNNWSISRYDSFEKKQLKVKLEILSQYARDIKSWLGAFTKPLVSSALQKFNFVNSYLRCSEDDFIMQGMCISCAFKLKINKYAYQVKKS